MTSLPMQKRTSTNQSAPNTPDGHALTVHAGYSGPPSAPVDLGSALFSFALPTAPVQRATFRLTPDLETIAGITVGANCGAVNENTTTAANVMDTLVPLAANQTVTELHQNEAVRVLVTRGVNLAIARGCTSITFWVSAQHNPPVSDLRASFYSREAAGNRPRIVFE